MAPAAVMRVSEPSDRLAAVVMAVAAPVSAAALVPRRLALLLALPVQQGRPDQPVALRRPAQQALLPSSLQHQPARRPSSCHACTNRRRQRAR
jgi:hypothetical protein